MINHLTKSKEKPIGCSQLGVLSDHLPALTDGYLDAALLRPVQEFFTRDSKQVRAQLVHVGFSLASNNEQRVTSSQQALLESLAFFVEALHAGSLMIDDIQDAEEIRRGGAALHMQIGIPRTINAANWLYFWPTDSLQKHDFAPGVEVEMYRLFHKTMMRAHQGQALDLGYDMTQVSQIEAREISLSTIELKTGELMGMCAELGALVGGADSIRRSSLAVFGRRFGMALQMFNDIGEVSSKNKSCPTPRPLLRPSWLWAVAAQELNSEEFGKFQRFMGHPEDSLKEGVELLGRVVTAARELARVEFENCMNHINDLVETSVHDSTRFLLQDLIQRVMRAYA